MKFRLVENINKLIAYNGSRKLFDKFSDNSKSETIGTDNFDIPGIYFANDKEFARNYACGESKGFYKDDNGEEHTFTRARGKGYVYTCELNYHKPIIIDYKKERDKAYADKCWEKRIYIAKNINKYKQEGYDIVLLLNMKYEPDGYIGNEYVVLNPNIIKIVDVEECEPEKE